MQVFMYDTIMGAAAQNVAPEKLQTGANPTFKFTYNIVRNVFRN
jgi:hypothetical protein